MPRSIFYDPSAGCFTTEFFVVLQDPYRTDLKVIFRMRQLFTPTTARGTPSVPNSLSNHQFIPYICPQYQGLSLWCLGGPTTTIAFAHSTYRAPLL